jgi:hypothetical protein
VIELKENRKVLPQDSTGAPQRAAGAEIALGEAAGGEERVGHRS